MEHSEEEIELRRFVETEVHADIVVRLPTLGHGDIRESHHNHLGLFQLDFVEGLDIP